MAKKLPFKDKGMRKIISDLQDIKTFTTHELSQKANARFTPPK